MAHVWGIESEFVDAESELWLLLYAANIVPPLEIASGIARVKAFNEMYERLAGQARYVGKRLWFESTMAIDSLGAEHCSWISLQPGEHRMSRPTAGNDHIVRVDPPPMHAEMRQFLREGYASVSKPSPGLVAAYHGLAERIDESFPVTSSGIIVHQTLPNPGASTNVARRFHLAALAMQQSREPDKILGARYVDLVEMHCDHSHFVSAMALLILQANLGQYIQQNVYESPAATLAAAKRLVSLSDSAERAAAALNAVGTSALTEGNASIKRALNALSPVEFGFWLYDAFGHFWMAFWNATVLDESGASNDCAYAAIEAEEGIACVCTGLHSAFASLLAVTTSTDRIDALITAGDIGGAEQLLASDSATLNPIRPRYLSKYLFADALIRSGNRTLCAQARDILKATLQNMSGAVDNRYPKARGIEICRLELALARAHDALNEFETAQALRVRVAGRMIVSRFLE